MGKRIIYISVALLLFTTSCRNYICPAYQSAFQRGETPLDKYFTFLPTDTLPADEARLSSQKFLAYFKKDSAFVPTGEVYARERIEYGDTIGASVIKHAKSSLFKNIITDNRQKIFRIGRKKNKKTGLAKKRIEDVVAYYTPKKGRKNIQRRNHQAVIRKFPTLPVTEEIVVIDTPTLDVIDEPFLVVDDDSLLLDLKPEDTTAIVEEEKESKTDNFPPSNFDQWYYEQEFGYLLYKDSTSNKTVSLDSLGMAENQGDSLGTIAPEKKGIFKKITSKFKKNGKGKKTEKEKTKKTKKKFSVKNPFKKKKKTDEDSTTVEDENGVFDSEDLDDIGDAHDDDVNDDDDDGGDDGG